MAEVTFLAYGVPVESSCLAIAWATTTTDVSERLSRLLGSSARRAFGFRTRRFRSCCSMTATRGGGAQTGGA